ncbi:unnamed protein product [Durusdinium trenchii]|uniref:Peptidase A1 domain-containing protein n=1 Tax=Durusdinium trenchii TaxID=1381693 RepID=A0ABP0IVM4_9DINO
MWLQVLLSSCLFLECFSLKTRELADSCAALKNRQSYSAVSIGVGTPPQHFDLVADTGSSAVIVTHCACQEASCYGYSSSCFTGTNRSETFVLPKDSEGDPHLLAMEFGSGVIYGVLATDVVSLGPVKARMNESLVLMYDHQLDSGITDFEGIFGLGLPYGEASAQSWLRQAAVQSFSMCFSNFEEDGVLRLLRGAKHEPMEEALQMRNVGKYHWALNFHGISLGNATTPVLFCGGASSCGLIPDSGTTLILGPPDHLLELFASLCDRWPRCAAAAERAANASSAQSIGISDWIKHAFERWGLPPIRSPFAPSPATERKMAKREAFESLLSTCSAWANSAEDLDAELPELLWHVSGAGDSRGDANSGNSQVLRMPGSAYVVAVGYEGRMGCVAFFGEIDLVTPSGPVWILGSAIFYEYVVKYDLSPDAAISFSKGPCSSCSTDTALALARRKSRQSRPIRRQESPVRMPRFNHSRLL